MNIQTNAIKTTSNTNVIQIDLGIDLETVKKLNQNRFNAIYTSLRD